MARAELFVDTSAWYPLVVPNHPAHRVLARELRQRVQRGVRVVTTNLVLAETHALLLHRVNRRVARHFAVTAPEPPNLVIPSSAELERRAILDWLDIYQDQDFSLADGVSFATMAERGIREALTLDRHFATAGFLAVGSRP